ncbi:hypothetical protein GCM10025876_32690 [Demequina litorisediminis]|uniref:Ribosome-binding factor A n=1 Tax=Demequina litorisediminis TaxID=1849022 RepID=A0ABQ6IID5_9MICO|nr:hypothetical protein GCM10025876_32690 [Demequina litorisediminis]
MVDNARAMRVAGTIKKVVARALETEIKDPRLGFVTVTDVRVTGDLQQASVFYTVYGGDEERAATAAALASAKGRLRTLVGREPVDSPHPVSRVPPRCGAGDGRHARQGAPRGAPA